MQIMYSAGTSKEISIPAVKANKNTQAITEMWNIIGQA